MQDQNPSTQSPVAAPAPVAPPAPSRNYRRLLVVGVLLVALIGAVAWFIQRQAPPASQAQVVGQVSVTATGFTPANLHVKAGSTVTWTNADTKVHQIAADPFPKDDSIAGFDSHQTLQPKDTYSFVFEKSGTYHYHDELDPFKLNGTIVVQ